MAIDYKVTIFISDEVLHKYWEHGLREELEILSQDGDSEDVYCGNWVVEFDDYEQAIKAERELNNLVDRYEQLHRRLTTAKEMTIADIEEKLGYPIKIVK